MTTTLSEIPDLVWLTAFPFAAALITTLVLTPIVRRIAIKNAIYDMPDAVLKPHAKPIPYLGGVAIYLGWLVALVVVSARFRPLAPYFLAAMAAGTLLMLTGLIDDLRHLSPKIKLGLQALAALCLLAFGLGRELVPQLVTPLAAWLPQSAGNWLTQTLSASPTPPWLFALSGLTIVGILIVATNAVNLIDGMDGLCTGVMTIANLACLLLLLLSPPAEGGAPLPLCQGGAGGGVWNGGEPAAANAPALISIFNFQLSTFATPLAKPQAAWYAVVALAATGVAVAAAFEQYNREPASIFMGDSGSLLFGTHAALLIILAAQAGGLRLALGMTMAFGFPIFDAVLALTRRKLHGKPWFLGDRSHFYDQLRDRGRTVKQTVWSCYAMSVLFGILAIAAAYLPLNYLLGLYAAAVLTLAAAVWRAGMLKVDDAHDGAAPIG